MKHARTSLIALLLALLLGAGTPAAWGQSRADSVRRERSELARQRQQTRQRLERNSAEVRRQLGRLDLLQANMDSSAARAARLSLRCDSMRRRRGALADSAAALEVLAARADSSYRQSLVALRRQRLKAAPHAFVLGSRSLRQAAARVRYLRQLSQWNASEHERLRTLHSRLAGTLQRLDSTSRRLSRTVRALDGARQRMSADSQEVAAIVVNLQARGDELNRELARQQQLMADLDRELTRALEEEEAQRTEAPAPSPVVARDFAEARGQLLMPVGGDATIVSNFGRHTHAQYSHVQTQNNGIDIEGAPGAPVRACHGGTVSMVIVMEGYGNVVLLRHGEYLTVYAGLARLSVRKGQEVAAGELLGYLPEDGAQAPRLHFEIRHEKDKLDPRPWLR